MSRALDYEARLKNIRVGLARVRSVQRTALIILWAALACVPFAGHLPLHGWNRAWPALLLAAIVALSVRRYLRNRSEWARLNRLEDFYAKGLARVTNRSAGAGFSGEEFLTSNHPYEPDLGILGAGSLFELICTARTEIGRSRLSDYLLLPSNLAEAGVRQDAVRELAAQPDLREEIALLGKFDFEESSGAVIADWLSTPVAVTNPAVRLFALAGSVAFAVLLVGTYFARPLAAQSWIDSAPWLCGLGVCNAAVAAIFRRQSKRALERASRVGLEIGVLRDGLCLVEQRQFASPKLRAIQANLSQHGAAHAVGQLARMTYALDKCNNPFLDLGARATIARTQIWFAVEAWKVRHGKALATWMHAWAEFEALAALSGYAYEHPENSYPVFVDDATSFHSTDFGHPLLPAATCVRNDVALDASHRFLVISGSNMAGKSTLLRSIGLNAVLAYAGAPVRAASMSISALRICASLSVIDSIRDGKSKLLAEMEKIRQMMLLAHAGVHVLFLIDEMLAGTNSKDRRIASESIVRAFVEHGAIGALSTHDLALTEIANMGELNASNVHMGARPGGDPLDFDYLLKPGVTQESNALAIAAMAGVLIDKPYRPGG